MLDACLLLAAFLAAVAGMGWLALAMEPHWEQACGQAPYQPALAGWLRRLGAAALAASLLLCLAVDHASMAVLVWFMVLAAATLVIAFTLSWRARWLAALLPGAAARA